MSAIYVIIGGGAGALVRHLVGQWIRVLALPSFTSTLFVNVLGSFLIGVAFAILVLGRETPHPFAPLIMTGFLGGFTTFSAFSLELVQLLSTGRIGIAVFYTLTSVTIGVLACYIGITMAR